MSDDADNLETPDGTTPAEVSPEEPETPSEPKPEADDAAGGEGTEEPQGEPQRDPAWENLAKKFAHIKDDDERRDAIAKAYWEKTNYASRIRRENETLKRQIARIESERKAAPKDSDEPAPPPQELTELDGQMKALADEDKSLYDEANAHIKDLNSISDEIAKAQARVEDAKEAGDEAKQARHEARLVAFEARKDNISRSYKALVRQRQTLRRDYDRLLKDRQWLAQTLDDRNSRQAREKQEFDDFKQTFPEQVDEVIESVATRLGIPDSYREELVSEVNDGLLVDLWKLGEADLDEVDVPGLVQARVQAFAKIRNLASRHKFQAASREKLKVAATTRPVAGGSATPAKKPVTPASMAGGDLTPKMKQARDYLVSRGW